MGVKISSPSLHCLHRGLVLFTVHMSLWALSTRSWGIIVFMATQGRDSSQNPALGMIIIFLKNFHEKVSLFLLLMLGS